MKPATSLCCWRVAAGTKRCTSSNPNSARRHTPPTVRTPLITVCSNLEIPLANQIDLHSSCYSGRRANPGTYGLSSSVGEKPVAGENEDCDEHHGPEYRGEEQHEHDPGQPDQPERPEPPPEAPPTETPPAEAPPEDECQEPVS